VYRRTISKNDGLLASSVLTQFANDIKQSTNIRGLSLYRQKINRDPQDPERKREKGLNNSPTLKIAIISWHGYVICGAITNRH
jgi:hypothetical protein